MDKRINWEVCLMAYGRITKKQTEILEYIKSQILNKGYPAHSYVTYVKLSI